MLRNFFSDFSSEKLILTLLQVVAVLICLIIHEVSHGLAAYAMGDPTAKANHRLSLNPLRHLDLLGLLAMVTCGFGWAKPVPVDPLYFRRPKFGMAITALAGPLSNFLLAFLSAIFLQAANAFQVLSPKGEAYDYLLIFLYILLTMNLGLALFNLIPIPPLDGSKILGALLPDRLYFALMSYERYGMIVLLLVLWSGWLDTPLLLVRETVTDAFLSATGFAARVVFSLFGG